MQKILRLKHLQHSLPNPSLSILSTLAPNQPSPLPLLFSVHKAWQEQPLDCFRQAKVDCLLGGVKEAGLGRTLLGVRLDYRVGPVQEC